MPYSSYLDAINNAIININYNNKKKWFSHVSRQAIKKYLNLSSDKFKYLNKALRKGVVSGELLQKRGSYRLPIDIYKKIKIS